MKSPPSRLWHLVAFLVFVAGAIGTPIFIVFSMIRLLSGGEELIAPGSHILELASPGKYVVWNVTATFRDGQQYRFPDQLPTGTRIRVYDEVAGVEIPTAASMSATESSGETRRRSICSFTINEPGTYRLVVDQLSEKRFLTVRQRTGWNVVVMFFGGLLFSFLCWIFAPAISIITEVRRFRYRRDLADENKNQT